MRWTSRGSGSACPATERLAEGHETAEVFSAILLAMDVTGLLQYLFLWHHMVEKAGTRLFSGAKSTRPRIYPLSGLGDPDDPRQEPG